jgi:FMN phosphatase YigB (HAD superfamily)
MTLARAATTARPASDRAPRPGRSVVNPQHPLLGDRTALAGCLVDMGSVLVDEHDTWRRWQQIALRELRAAGIGVDRLTLRRALREGIATRQPRVTQAVLRHLGADEAVPARIHAQVENADRPLPDAAAALERLSRQVPLVLVANQGLHARALLEQAGLHRYFRTLLLSAELGVSKPDLAIFERGLAALGTTPDRVAMIGDRLDFDIGPARQLGLLTLRVRRGPFCWQQPVTPEERPHRTFPSLSATAAWLAP